MGLTFCVDLCRGDGQEIWLADNPGGGTVACFTLTAAKPNDSGKALADSNPAEFGAAPVQDRKIA